MEVYIWLGLMVLFLLIEAACPIHLVSLWFAAGALTALIAAGLNAPVWLQAVVFLAVSVGLLAALFPLARRHLTPKITKTNADSVIGTQGCVLESIDNLRSRGRVKLGGMEWSARSADGGIIPEGTRIRVEKIEGVKVFVSPVLEEKE